MSYKAVYARHKAKDFTTCETLEEAVSFLSEGAEHSGLFPICIVEPDGKLLTRADGIKIATVPMHQILQQLAISTNGEVGTFTT